MTGAHQPGGLTAAAAARPAAASPASAASPARPASAASPARPASAAGRWPAGGRSWLAASASLLLFLAEQLSQVLRNDTYYNLFAGRYILQHGIPRRNVVTVVAHGAPWIDQQWLAHLAYYGAWRAGGYPAVAAVSAVLVAAGFTVLGLLMQRRGVPPTRAIIWVFAAYLVSVGFIMIRAQSFAFLFFAVTLWLIAEDDAAPRLRGRTWLAVPILMLWANVHGSVLLGAGLAVLYAGYRITGALRRGDKGALAGYLAFAAAAGAAPLCTPYGLAIIRFYLRFEGNRVLPRFTPEWARPDLRFWANWPFFALLLLIAVVLAVAWRRGTRPSIQLSVLTAILLALTFIAMRNQIWFGFAGTLLAADTLARGSGGRVPVPGRLFRRAVAAVLACVALGGLAVIGQLPARQFASMTPVRAIGVAAGIAARNPGTRVLGDDRSASAMLWLHPAMSGRVAFDARLEQYPDRQLLAYLDFLTRRGRRWDRVLTGYGIVVVYWPTNPSLARSLISLPGWRVAYRDREGLVLTRPAVR